MICPSCRNAADMRIEHSGCAGETWCDCQHHPQPEPTDREDADR